LEADESNVAIRIKAPDQLRGKHESAVEDANKYRIFSSQIIVDLSSDPVDCLEKDVFGYEDLKPFVF
jgi:hypothetical protein